MTDIPEDVMKTAKAAYYEEAAKPLANFQYAIARAILAERERCAAVADESRARSLREESKGVHALFDYRFAASKAGEIATSIRNPKGYLNGPA